MAFIKKPFRRLAEGAEADTYIDLGELNFEGEGGALGEPVEHLVKVAEVYRYEDIADLTTHVYNGNILLIDYTSLASDDLALKRITAELKSAVRDCGGDVATTIERRKWKKWNSSFRTSCRWAIETSTSIVSMTTRSIFSR